jgi:hypothetical protein
MQKQLSLFYRPFPTKPTSVAYFEGLSDVLQQKNTLKMQNFAFNNPFGLFSWLFDCCFLPKLLKNVLIAMTLAVAGVKK